MYVCICKGITESQIHDAVDSGLASMDELSERLGVASGCGTCESFAEEVLIEGLARRSRYRRLDPRAITPAAA